MDIEAELTYAQAAMQAGNIGQARVCARRAAGMAVREWYRRRKGKGDSAYWGGDALKQLQRLEADGLALERIRTAARRLTTKVDFDHNLPFDTNPIEDARLIIEYVRQAG